MLLELLAAGQLKSYQPTVTTFINIKPELSLTELAPVELLEAPPLEKLETLSLIQPKAVKASTAPLRGSQPGNTYQRGQCTWHVKNLKPSIPNGWGNASNWRYAAARAGWTVSSKPVVGAVGTRGNHVVYVTAVSGNQVTVSEMNYNYVPYSQRTITVNASNYTYIY